MKTLRLLLATALLGTASLAGVAATPAKADAYFYNYFGAYRNPYYYNNYRYNPYSAYGNYSRTGRYGSGLGGYGGYGASNLGGYGRLRQLRGRPLRLRLLEPLL